MELVWFYIVITESIDITDIIFCYICYRENQLPLFCITMTLTIKPLNWPNNFSTEIETQYFFKEVETKDPGEN